MTPEQLEKGKKIDASIKKLKERFRIFSGLSSEPIKSVGVTTRSSFLTVYQRDHSDNKDTGLTGKREAKALMLASIFTDGMQTLYNEELAVLNLDMSKV